MANSIFMEFGGFQDLGGGSVSTPGSITAGSAATGSFYAADGTAGLPSYSFTSEPTLGLRRSSAGVMTLQGGLVTTGTIVGSSLYATSTGELGIQARLSIWSNALGLINLGITNQTIGSVLKVDALPTIASGFGAAAAIIAGSTPLAGSVNTGAISASGVINFNGTAFVSAPSVVAMNQTTGLAVKAVVSATQLTLSPATGNFAANDIVSWIAIGSK